MSDRPIIVVSSAVQMSLIFTVSAQFDLLQLVIETGTLKLLYISDFCIVIWKFSNGQLCRKMGSASDV